VQVSGVIAALALVLSVISLLWQARTWRSSGPVIKVDLHYADASVFTVGKPAEVQARLNEEQDPWLYFVVVRNRGRAPATVEKVEIGDSDSAILDLAQYIVAEHSGKLPPVRLQSASTVRWLIPLRRVTDGMNDELDRRVARKEKFHRAEPVTEGLREKLSFYGHGIGLTRLRAWVTVGNGDVIVSHAVYPVGRLERGLMRLTVAVVALRDFRHIWRDSA
jgi:hypothetical protein